MATEKAVLPVVLVGGAAVVEGLSRIDKAFGKLGSAIASNAVPALKTVGGAIGGLVSDGLRAAGVLQTISLANAVEDAKRLDLATAKLGQSAGVSGSILKSNFDAVEKKTLTSSVAMADFSRSLGWATYDSKFAADSVGALGEEALAVGRDLGDELPLAVALRGLGTEARDLPNELGRIRDMAERIGTVGGHMALKDTLAALGPQLAGVSMQAPDARVKLEALIAVLGKGLKPEQATAVGSAALQTIRSRALDIERVTGRRVLDDNNELVDPTQTLKDLKKLADRRYGTKNTEAKRRALMTEFTPDLGLAIYRSDFSEVDRLKTLATNKEKTEAEAEKFRQSKEGKRIEAGLAKDQAMRGVGSELAGVHDTLVDTLGVPGAMGVELVGGHVALAGAKALGGKILAGSVGAGATAVGGALAGTAALQLAAVSSLGGDRTQMGKQYISERAQLLGQDIAAAAIARGDVMPVIGRAKGDKEIQAATMEALLLKFDQLNATLQGQANAYAEAMGRKVLKVAMPADPNAPKGN
ncbi:MAG: hypothetical protein E6Q97_34470 [Desulfurellales bacterium]|nr:MAG: hypothetical protein E6Q97_34470 [Desulfurellales bacterium]